MKCVYCQRNAVGGFGSKDEPLCIVHAFRHPTQAELFDIKQNELNRGNE